LVGARFGIFAKIKSRVVEEREIKYSITAQVHNRCIDDNIRKKVSSRRKEEDGAIGRRATFTFNWALREYCSI
jgi:hypothetical protein